jgi:hypothetical protein
MARAPVQPLPLTEQLRPVASPVDTYVRPQESSFRGLAQALGVFDSSLQGFLSVRDKKKQEEDYLRGKAAFYSDHEGALSEAVTSGKIPAQYSPTYVRGFKEAQGAAAGQALRTKWNDAWDNWSGKDSEDPQAFDTFFQQFVADNLGTQDPDVLKGVLPAVEALQANATTQYTQYRHDQTVRGSIDSHGAAIAGTVQEGLVSGMAEPSGTDYLAIFTNVNRVVAQQLATGDPGGRAVDTFIDVMGGKILGMEDAKLLDWFDTKVPGKDYTYGQTPHGIEVRNATINGLEGKARAQAAGLSAAERREMERKKDEAQVGVINSILTNPDAPIPEATLQQAEMNGDPLIRLHAKQWRNDLMQGTTDPRKVKAFYDDVVSGRVSPKQALMEALGASVFGTAEDMRAAVTFVQNFQTVEGAVGKTLNGQLARQYIEVIRQRTQDKDKVGNALLGTSDDGFAAMSDFRQLVTRWVMANPNATQPEIEEQVAKFGKMITDRFAPPVGGSSFFDPNKYYRDPALPFGNPYANPSATGQMPAPQAGAGGGSSDPAVQQWERAQNVTPEQRAQLKAMAARSGMSYDEYIHERALHDVRPLPSGR